MKNEQTCKIVRRIFTGIFILIVIPIFIICFYTNPSPEDFYYAHEAKVKSLCENTHIQYKHGTGRYFQNFLLYLTPLYENPFTAYKIVCFIFMVLFFVAILIAVNLLVRNKISLEEKLFTGLVLFFIYVYCMPEIASGFYWYGGITAYHSGLILVPVFLLFFIKSENSPNASRKIVYGIISFFIMIFLIGVNEILAILVFLFILTLNFSTMFAAGKRKKIVWKYIFFAAAAGVFLYILIKSPGNKFRLTQFPGNQNISFSLLNSFYYLAENIFQLLFTTPLIACTLILLPVYSGISSRLEGSKKNLWNSLVWFPIVWFAILIISVFFSFYSATVVMNRTSNFIYFIFLCGWFYFIFILCEKFYRKFRINFTDYCKYFYPVSVVILLLFFFKENNITTAVSDLFSGSANSYNEQMNERFQKIRNCTTDTCRVDSLKNIPTTIYYRDITSDPTLLSSEWYGRFFNKSSVVTMKRK